ncbi:MAG: MaoC family dehydratase [Dehalococcoidia bacterium]
MATNITFDEIDLGDEIGPSDKIITTEQVFEFVKILESKIEASRFTDSEFAKSEGLNGPIVPGALTTAVMAQFVSNWAKNLKIKTLDVIFRHMVPHNTTLKLIGIFTDKFTEDGLDQLQCDVFLQDENEVKLVIGKATIIVNKK